jgi:hypothetical protein
MSGYCPDCGNTQCLCKEVAAGEARAESSFAAPQLLGCGMCGGKLVEIRGRHPQEKSRQVCPTCLAERMDQMRNISAADYGMAYEAHPNGELSDRTPKT